MEIKSIITNDVKESGEGTTFGKYFEMKMPEGCDVVIVCRNEGFGLRPMSLKLPHQVYEKYFEEKLIEFPRTRTFTLIPANSKHY